MSRLSQHAVHCMHKPTGAYAGRAICGEVFRSACQANVLRESLELAGWTRIKLRGENVAWFCPAHKPPPQTMEQKYGSSSRS